MLNKWTPCPSWETELGSVIRQLDVLKCEFLPRVYRKHFESFIDRYLTDILGLLVLFYFIFQQVNLKELRSFYVKTPSRLRDFQMWRLAVCCIKFQTTVKLFTAERNSDFRYVKCFQYFSWCEDKRMNVNVAYIRKWILCKNTIFFLFAALWKHSPIIGTVSCNSSRSMKELHFFQFCSLQMKVIAMIRYLYSRLKRFNKCLIQGYS